MIMDWEDVSAGNVMGSTVGNTQLVGMYGEKTFEKPVGDSHGWEKKSCMGKRWNRITHHVFGIW
jgi:hypothetical protein